MHALDITDDQVAFVTREDAWHTLGNVLHRAFTAEEAMREGLLGGWNVRKWPAYAVHPETGMILPKEGRFDVVRDNPVRKDQIDWLGEVGSSYTIIQNEEHAQLLDTLVDESGAHFETAGSIDGGRVVFISMKLPGHILVGGVDPVDNYISAINSMDGSMAFTLMVTPVRPVCKNTVVAGFKAAKHMFRIRHTSGAEAAVRTQARQALDMSFKYLDGFQEEAEQMINMEMSLSRFEEIIEKEFGPEEDASRAAVTRAEKKVEQITELFADAVTHSEVRNTAWAGFNAIIEWADHFSPTRGDEREVSRAKKSLFDLTIKDRARELMLQG